MAAVDARPILGHVRLENEQARDRIVRARVARLATASSAGVPHLVPVTFAVVRDTIVFAVDHKPKRSTNLRRLRNIEANAAVSFLVDHYADDWTQLWWARADGTATILPGIAEWPEAATALAEKYEQYSATTPEGPLVRTDISTWTGWAAAPQG